MSIAVNWYNDDKTIIYWKFAGKWDWNEYAEAQDVSNAMLDTVDHTVDVIGNVQESPSLPANALSVYRSNLSSAHPNTGLIVLVGASMFVEQMVRLLKQMFRNKVAGTNFEFAKSDEEALALIASRSTSKTPDRR